MCSVTQADVIYSWLDYGSFQTGTAEPVGVSLSLCLHDGKPIKNTEIRSIVAIAEWAFSLLIFDCYLSQEYTLQGGLSGFMVFEL